MNRPLRMPRTLTTPDTEGVLELEAAFDAILHGVHARRAIGFLVQLPPGFLGVGPLRAALRAAYGALEHPDLRILGPTTATGQIGVDGLRDVLPFLAATPSGAQMKTLVVSPAHRLNESAANAFLKSLEEPTAHTRILLLTDAPFTLPATILSRVLKLPVHSGPAAARREIADQIREMRGGGDAVAGSSEVAIPPAQLDAALVAAAGRPDDAAALILHEVMPWIEAVSGWLEKSRPGVAPPAPPLPVLSGKAAVPIATCARALMTRVHASLLAATGADPSGPAIPGWSGERALAAVYRIDSALADIDRPGLDSRLRLHRLLVTLAA